MLNVRHMVPQPSSSCSCSCCSSWQLQTTACSIVHLSFDLCTFAGGGNVLNVQRTVRQLINVGAKGVFLEDQKWPKKTGQMRNKDVISMDEFAAKVRGKGRRRRWGGGVQVAAGEWTIGSSSSSSSGSSRLIGSLTLGYCCAGRADGYF